MSEIIDVQQALKAAIQTEKDAMDFYKYGAEKMPDDQARKTFEILARDEMQHARMFYDVYSGGELPSFEEYIHLPPNTESSWWKALQRMMLSDFDERKALELAVEQEELLEEELRATARKINNPQIRAIYEANANSTHSHALQVTDDLKALFGQS